MLRSFMTSARILVTLLVATLSVASLLARPSGTLSPKEIDEAIAQGQYGEPAPYLLHFVSPTPGKVNPVILGVVYTPFVRITLAARAARESRREFTRDDVSPNLSEPVFYVALRWYCCDRERSDPSTFDPFTPFDYKVAVPTDRQVPMSLGGLRLTDPLWVSRDLSLLSTFGGELPYQDIVLIAAYPMSALSSNRDFAIFRESSSSDGLQRHLDIRAGRITDAEFAQWR